MRLELDIPDWCDDSWLYLMKGIELVAYKWPGQKWMVKTSRCNLCGKCCLKTKRIRRNEDGSWEKGPCDELEQKGSEWRCKLGSGRPWSCSIIVSNIPGCTEKFK